MNLTLAEYKAWKKAERAAKKATGTQAPRQNKRKKAGLEETPQDNPQSLEQPKKRQKVDEKGDTGKDTTTPNTHQDSEQPVATSSPPSPGFVKSISPVSPAQADSQVDSSSNHKTPGASAMDSVNLEQLHSVFSPPPPQGYTSPLPSPSPVPPSSVGTFEPPGHREKDFINGIAGVQCSDRCPTVKWNSSPRPFETVLPYITMPGESENILSLVSTVLSSCGWFSDGVLGRGWCAFHGGMPRSERENLQLYPDTRA